MSSTNTGFQNGRIEADFILLLSPRSMSKSSSEIDEEGACPDGESSRSNFAPPRKSKRVTLDQGDPRKWASLHKQAAGVTARNPLLALTPPQEGERGASNIDVDARVPGGMSALHLASCYCGYDDGSSLDDCYNKMRYAV